MIGNQRLSLVRINCLSYPSIAPKLPIDRAWATHRLHLSYPSIAPKLPIYSTKLPIDFAQDTHRSPIKCSIQWLSFEGYSINSYHQKTVPTDLYVVLNALSDIYDARLQPCSYSYKKRYICVTSTYAVRTSYLLHHMDWLTMIYIHIRMRNQTGYPNMYRCHG